MCLGQIRTFRGARIEDGDLRNLGFGLTNDNTAASGMCIQMQTLAVAHLCILLQCGSASERKGGQKGGFCKLYYRISGLGIYEGPKLAAEVPGSAAPESNWSWSWLLSTILRFESYVGRRMAQTQQLIAKLFNLG